MLLHGMGMNKVKPGLKIRNFCKIQAAELKFRRSIKGCTDKARSKKSYMQGPEYLGILNKYKHSWLDRKWLAYLNWLGNDRLQKLAFRYKAERYTDRGRWQRSYNRLELIPGGLMNEKITCSNRFRPRYVLCEWIYNFNVKFRVEFWPFEIFSTHVVFIVMPFVSSRGKLKYVFEPSNWDS